MNPTIPIILAVAMPLIVVAEGGYGPIGSQHAPSSYRAPADLVPSGAFIDRILPMPVPNGLRSERFGSARTDSSRSAKSPANRPIRKSPPR